MDDRTRRAVFSRDEHTCQNCGARGGPVGEADLYVHHGVPVHRGGTDRMGNLRTYCRDCRRAIVGESMAPTAVDTDVGPDAPTPRSTALWTFSVAGPFFTALSYFLASVFASPHDLFSHPVVPFLQYGFAAAAFVALLFYVTGRLYGPRTTGRRRPGVPARTPLPTRR